MTEQADGKPKRLHAPGERDWFLQQLVKMANKSSDPEPFGFPVTLCVNGLLVTGTIVGGRHYFKGFAANVTASMGDIDAETRTKVGQFFESFGDFYKPEPDDDETEGAGASDAANATRNADADDTRDITKDFPEFIHLMNAKVYNGQTFVPTHGGVWWRGRIAEVDGFILGTIGLGR